MFYYSEDGKKSYSNRIDAIKTERPCFFYFNDKEFSKMSWHIEPTKSLKELYKKRAEQIRHDYDYIILAYSGGIDSHNILETFYFNKILIDEILMVGSFSQDKTKGSDDNHNGEIYHMAYPTVTSTMKLPNTKITTFDYTELFSNIENFSLIKNYGSDWIKEMGAFYSVHNLFWRDLKKFIGKNNDKKTAVIFGAEKPNYHWDFEKNAPYTMFGDSGFTSYGNFQGEDNFHKVDFYVSPQTEDLMKKQLHIVNNFFIENVLIKKIISVPVFYNSYTKFIDKLIYDPIIPIIFKSKKSTTPIISVRDQFILDKKSSDIYNIFKDGLKKLPSLNLTPKFQIDEFFVIDSFITRKYYLTQGIL